MSKLRQWSEFTPEQIQAAREVVADEWKRNALAILADADAPDFKFSRKGARTLGEARLAEVEEIRAGKLDWTLCIQQRLYLELTGVCVPILP